MSNAPKLEPTEDRPICPLCDGSGQALHEGVLVSCWRCNGCGLTWADEYDKAVIEVRDLQIKSLKYDLRELNQYAESLERKLKAVDHE